MAREYQENLVTPINMTCYLCNESLGSSLCNYCKSQFPFHDLDDNAFKIVLYEFQHGTISYDADHLETLFFNPILDQHSTLSDPNSDLDPDLNNLNYASSASYCNYETAEDLNGVIGGNNLISFSLFHLNARSLVKNQDALAHLLANINHKDGKASEADNIPISIIKKTLDLISDPLLSIINLSLSSGVFPDRLKISKIIPIFKSDNASLAQNYRPISILPAFSKIFERAVYNRIFQFLVDNDILFKHQFGFRPGHSTSHALINFVNKVANAVGCQKYLAGIFLDLSKALI